MKTRSILIFLLIIVALLPAFYINRMIRERIRPRESAARFFLFFLVNFLLIIVYTVTIVAIIIRLFPVK